MMRTRRLAVIAVLLLVALFTGPRTIAQEKPGDSPAAGRQAEILPGHSIHGEAFDDGPRQRAYLMKGMGKVDFPVTTRVPLAQKFFDQGVAQLHGFWFYEAERSFRKVAALDPDCAMAYWGMAMANGSNEKRAKEFIAQAVKYKAHASPREIAWIDALSRYYTADSRSEKDRDKEYAKSLDQIVQRYPHDIEAKAFYALQLWSNDFQMTKEQREKVDKLLEEVLAANPMHPCHHYRIHLWNYNDDARALSSAALCGPSVPGIAHMWHMPGHTYSVLKRYADAAWQQEASARVDHAQMMRDCVMPDQIHNYAHNNEWLIRDLMAVGRVHDAIDLAKNMIELPRHPKYNDLGVGGSAPLGRQRLLDVLIKYEMWDELIRLSDSVYLQPTEIENIEAERIHALGLAYFHTGDKPKGAEQIAALEKLVEKQKSLRNEAGDKAEAEARKNNQPADKIASARKCAMEYLNNEIEKMGKKVAELRAYQTLSAGDRDTARKLFADNKEAPKDRLARVWMALSDTERAQSLAKEACASAQNEVEPLANCADILYRSGKEPEAIEKFQELRKLSSQIDLDAPVFQRLAPIARSLNLSSDWRAPATPAPDIGLRPALDSLGPFRWQPMPALDWSLRDSSGKRVSLRDYRGRPVLVFFFLGAGCSHCIEQLDRFTPMAKEFQAAGISMVAISADTSEGFKLFMANARASKYPFPILADGHLDVFKRYRCYDDFEKKPLHGTFLIDGRGLVRWQDISYEPFTNPRFLLTESQRLLKQPTPTKAIRSAGATSRQ